MEDARSELRAENCAARKNARNCAAAHIAAKDISGSWSAPGLAPTPSTTMSQRGHLPRTWLPSRAAAASQSSSPPIPQLAADGLSLRSTATTFHWPQSRRATASHESSTVSSAIEREYHIRSTECATRKTSSPCAAARCATASSISVYDTGWPSGASAAFSFFENAVVLSGSSKRTCWCRNGSRTALKPWRETNASRSSIDWWSSPSGHAATLSAPHQVMPLIRSGWPAATSPPSTDVSSSSGCESDVDPIVFVAPAGG